MIRHGRGGLAGLYTIQSVTAIAERGRDSTTWHGRHKKVVGGATRDFSLIAGSAPA